MSGSVVRLLLVVALLAGCTKTEIDFSGRSCHHGSCIQGWTCDAETNLCVQESGHGDAPGGDESAGEDGRRPDGAGDPQILGDGLAGDPMPGDGGDSMLGEGGDPMLGDGGDPMLGDVGDSSLAGDPLGHDPPWWNFAYSYRRQINVTAQAAVPTDYSIQLTFDHAALVSVLKSEDTGDDLRVCCWTGTIWLEVDRVLGAGSGWDAGSTTIWFQLPASIPATQTRGRCYLYYGNQASTSPPADPKGVYLFWDDFDDGALDAAWSFDQINSTGNYNESGTAIRLTGTSTGDLWDTSDSVLFLSIEANDDVLVESYTSGSGGNHNSWSKMGGVQVRQSIAGGSKNRIMSLVRSAEGATNSYRLTANDLTDEQTTTTRPDYNRISRVGGTSRAWYSTDGLIWTELGTEVTFVGGLTNPIRIGSHLAGISSSAHWVEIDWFKVRKYVESEPTAGLGAEEAGQ